MSENLLMKANIQLIRVDNRLVHGQVGVSWVNSLDIDTIVVVDNDTVNDIVPKKLMSNIAKASNVKISFYSVDNFLNVYKNNNSNQKLFVVVRKIATVYELCKKGLEAQSVNIGNIHYEKGRFPFNKKVYLNQEDVDEINCLLDKGYDIFFQDVPGTSVEKFNHLIFEKMKRR